jgi:hypothetical protein
MRRNGRSWRPSAVARRTLRRPRDPDPPLRSRTQPAHPRRSPCTCARAPGSCGAASTSSRFSALISPSLRPASPASCSIQRCRHESLIPRFLTTWATGSPAAPRSSARRRNSGGRALHHAARDKRHVRDAPSAPAGQSDTARTCSPDPRLNRPARRVAEVLHDLLLSFTASANTLLALSLGCRYLRAGIRDRSGAPPSGQWR